MPWAGSGPAPLVLDQLAVTGEEPWWRIPLACSHGLSLAQRTSELKDRPSEPLPALQQLHALNDGLPC